MNEYARLNGDIVAKWFLDGNLGKKHRIRYIFLQGKPDGAFPVFFPFAGRNICHMDNLI
jgi:hypothetical protein